MRSRRAVTLAASLRPLFVDGSVRLLWGAVCDIHLSFHIWLTRDRRTENWTRMTCDRQAARERCGRARPRPAAREARGHATAPCARGACGAADGVAPERAA